MGTLLASDASRLAGARILLAEDDPDLCDGIADLLESDGATVERRPSGNAAFESFLEARPDVIVSDLWMPDGTGFSFIQRVRQLPEDAGRLTPAIAMSAAENMRCALLAGFHAFLDKPFDAAKLVEMIADFTSPARVQAVAPWTIAPIEPGKLLLTLVGRLESGDMRALATALVAHLEETHVDLVVDERALTWFAPSVGSVAERGLWRHRRRLHSIRIVGASLAARIVSAASCKLLGIPCAFAATHGGAAQAEP